MLYLSQLLGAPVLDQHGMRVGKIVDVLMHIPHLDQNDPTYPTVLLVEIEDEEQDRRVPIRTIQRHDGAWQVLQPLEQFALQADTQLDDEVHLSQEVLDKQVIDVEHKRAVRVSDVCFGDDWRVLGIDRSPLGLVRRLAPGWLQNAISQQSSTTLISWSQIELIGDQHTKADTDTPVSALPPSPSSKMRTLSRHLQELHPADIAGIVHQLTAEQGARVIERLDDKTAADTMEEIDTERQALILENLRPEGATRILQAMGPDEVADLLSQIPEDRARQLLHLMNPEDSEEVQELLEYAPDTAGGMMTTDYTALNRTHTVQEAFEIIRSDIKKYDVRIAYIYCVEDENQEENRLVGVVSLWDLLTAEPLRTLQELMETDLITVAPDSDPQSVAEVMAKYNLLAVPVVNEGGVIEGVVTVDDVLDILLPPERRRKPRRMY